MSNISSRARRPAGVVSGAPGRRSRRGWVALVLLLGLLVTSTACGMDVQTMKPYTPAEGVNVDVGNSGDPNNVVHVRNLSIISHAPGEGILSGSLLCNSSDALSGASGIAIKADGSDGAPFTATIPAPIPIADGKLVVLTGTSLVTVNSADLAPGLTAVVTLQFRNAGQTTVRVPVVDGREPQYATITPSPTSSPPAP